MSKTKDARSDLREMAKQLESLSEKDRIYIAGALAMAKTQQVHRVAQKGA